MHELIINSNLATAEPGHFEMQKLPQIRNIFEKKDCFTPDSNLEQQKLQLIDLPTCH